MGIDGCSKDCYGFAVFGESGIGGEVVAGAGLAEEVYCGGRRHGILIIGRSTSCYEG